LLWRQAGIKNQNITSVPEGHYNRTKVAPRPLHYDYSVPRAWVSNQRCADILDRKSYLFLRTSNCQKIICTNIYFKVRKPKNYLKCTKVACRYWSQINDKSKYRTFAIINIMIFKNLSLTKIVKHPKISLKIQKSCVKNTVMQKKLIKKVKKQKNRNRKITNE